ncbi:MAG: metallophosphoesterase [Verrucomicrobiota bacterium]
MQTTQQLKFGLLNDLHYDGGVQALNRLYESVAALNQGGAKLMVVLGDLIDSSGKSNAERLLREVSALCDSFHGVVRYMPGNHDLDYLSKAQFYNALGCAGDPAACGFKHEGIDFICIDGNFSPDGTEYDSGNFRWEKSLVPDEQLAWLQEQLADASAPVVLFSHQRIDIPGDFSIQNHMAVLEIIRLSGKVKAVFQGHQHADDLQQVDGATYYTLAAHKDDAGPAIVEVGPQNILLSRDFHPPEIV